MGLLNFFKKADSRAEATNFILGTVDPSSPLYGHSLSDLYGVTEKERNAVVQTLGRADQQSNGSKADPETWQTKAAETWDVLTRTPRFPELKGDSTGTRMLKMSRQAYSKAKSFCPPLARTALRTALDCVDRIVFLDCYDAKAHPDIPGQVEALGEIATVAGQLKEAEVREKAMDKLKDIASQKQNMEVASVAQTLIDLTKGPDTALAQFAETLLSGAGPETTATLPRPKGHPAPLEEDKL